MGIRIPKLIIDGVGLKQQILDDTFLSLTAKDEAGLSNDYVVVSLEDTGKFKKPDLGSSISVSLGYEDTGTYRLGKFTVNKITKRKEGSTKAIDITCISASHNSKFKESGKREFKGSTINTIVDTIATISNLESRVDPDIKDLVYTIIQNGETNQGFLRKLAESVDSIVKVTDGRLYFGKRQNKKKVDGSFINNKTINEADEMLTYTYSDDGISKYSGIKVKYYDSTGEVITTKVVGTDDDSVKELAKTYTSEDEATKAGDSMLNKLVREKQKLTFETEGDRHIPAESQLTVVSDDTDLAQDWIVSQVSYNFSKGNLRAVYSCEAVTK